MRLWKGINTITDNTTLRNFVQTIILSTCMFLSNNLSASNLNSPTLAWDSSDLVTTINNSEASEKVVDPKTIVGLVRNYLDNGVKFKLSDSAKKEVEEILWTYLNNNHTILVINHNNEVVFNIDNNDEFREMIKNAVLAAIPEIEKKINNNNVLEQVWLSVWLLFKGTNKKELQKLLDWLKEDFYLTVYSMPQKEYDNIMKELFGIVEGNFPLNIEESCIHLREVLPNKYTYFPKQTAKL